MVSAGSWCHLANEIDSALSVKSGRRAVNMLATDCFLWCADDWATRRLGESLGDRLLGDKAGRLGDTGTAVAYSGCKYCKQY